MHKGISGDIIYFSRQLFFGASVAYYDVDQV